MTEGINFSYDGGLYAELIRNRTFNNYAKLPVNWSILQEAGSKCSIGLDEKNAINTALTTCLKLHLEEAHGRAGIVNEGYCLAITMRTWYLYTIRMNTLPQQR
jgi:alpha-N-arabinofuranosidase